MKQKRFILTKAQWDSVKIWSISLSSPIFYVLVFAILMREGINELKKLKKK